MATRIGINGFGRIGRLVVRAAMKRRAPLEFVAVNDLTDAKTLAHLLRYDSVHRTWPEVGPAADGAIPIGGTRIKVLSEKDPTKLPWKDLGVELVVEATGRFTDRAGGAQHLAAGARAVLISAPAKDVDLTFVIGVNDDQLRPRQAHRGEHRLVHHQRSRPGGQGPARHLRDRARPDDHNPRLHQRPERARLPAQGPAARARAAVNMIPTSTGAAKAIGLVLPELKGKLDGISVRVPVMDASLVDLVCRVLKATDATAVNAAMKDASEKRLKGILEYCTDPIVSSDVIGNPASSVFDSLSTNVLDGKLIKILAWYDNEWAFSERDGRRADQDGRLIRPDPGTWRARSRVCSGSMRAASACSCASTSTMPIKDGQVADDTRIVASLPTIRYLLQRARARDPDVAPRPPQGRPRSQVRHEAGGDAPRAAAAHADRLRRRLRRPRRRAEGPGAEGRRGAAAREPALPPRGGGQRSRRSRAASPRSARSTSTTRSAPRTARTPPPRACRDSSSLRSPGS